MVTRSPERMAIRSTTFFSSRTLPGHLRATSARDDVVVDRLGLDAVLARERSMNALREERDVLDALAQRGAADREDVEPEEEVLAEGPRLDRLREILVRRGEHAHVDVHHVLAADARDLAGLERAEHLGLRDEVHVADLVEEERAAVGLLEEARASWPARR